MLMQEVNMCRFKKGLVSKIIIALTAILILNSFCYLGYNQSFASENNKFFEVPLNPDYVEYVNNRKNHTEEKFGYIPSPFIIKRSEYNEGNKSLLFEANSLPEQYSSIEYQTSVKDQHIDGPCWAFATLSVLESYLLRNNRGYYDFSERNMMNNHGYDLDYDQGGNFSIASAYLTSWKGPVFEEDDYPYYEPDSNTVGYKEENVRMHVQGIYWIPPLPSGENRKLADLDEIKQAVMQYGAVGTTIYWHEDYYDANNFSYYYDGEESPNHEVVIVGWNDNYNWNNFNSSIQKNGAFIVKNSWGEDFGDNGYFYISYYDVSLGRENWCFTNVEDVNNYDNIYQYDPFGPVTMLGTNNSDYSAWFANVFTLDSDNDEFLEAVSFYTSVAECPYEIYINPSFSGDSIQGLNKVKNGTIANPGYHTIKLNSPVRIKKNEKFVVAIKLITPGDRYQVFVEKPFQYLSNATASRNQSYLSIDGNDWIDLTSLRIGDNSFENANVCLKAFTTNCKPVISFDASNYSINETDGSITIHMERTENTTDSVSFNYMTVDGTAKAGKDYISSVGTVRFEKGETRKSITIDIVNDKEAEGEETFFVVLTDNSDSVIFHQSSVEVTINDNVVSKSGLLIAPVSLKIGNKELSSTEKLSDINIPINDTITASVHIKNNCSETRGMKLIVALIKTENGIDQLKQVSICPIDFVTGAQTYLFSATMNIDIEDTVGYKIKVYLWNDMDQRIPYIPVQEY